MMKQKKKMLKKNTHKKKKNIFPEERQQIIEELRLVPKKDVRIKIPIPRIKATNY